MNMFLRAWESKLWTYLVLYSPVGKLLYPVWMAVTVFPTLWLFYGFFYLLILANWFDELWVSADDLGLSQTIKFLLMPNWDHREQCCAPQTVRRYKEDCQQYSGFIRRTVYICVWIEGIRISWIQHSSVGNHVCSGHLYYLPAWCTSVTLRE